MNYQTIVAAVTETTCGEACWTAREDVCRCSCGGKNHGCLRSADGVQPARGCKINGVRYELQAVGGERDLEEQGIEMNAKEKGRRYYGSVRVHDEYSRGAKAKIKPADKSQIERWPELAHYRHTLALGDWEFYQQKPWLLWVRVA